MQKGAEKHEKNGIERHDGPQRRESAVLHRIRAPRQSDISSFLRNSKIVGRLCRFGTLDPVCSHRSMLLISVLIAINR
jgi:hypothetical protein